MLKKAHCRLILVGVALLFVTPLSAFAHHLGFSVQVGVSSGPFIHHRPVFIHRHPGVFFHGPVFFPFPPVVVVGPPPPVVYAPPPLPIIVVPAPPAAAATLQILVAPLQAEIYLDGRYIGRAEEFRDGRV